MSKQTFKFYYRMARVAYKLEINLTDAINENCAGHTEARVAEICLFYRNWFHNS